MRFNPLARQSRMRCGIYSISVVGLLVSASLQAQVYDCQHESSALTTRWTIKSDTVLRDQKGHELEYQVEERKAGRVIARSPVSNSMVVINPLEGSQARVHSINMTQQGNPWNVVSYSCSELRKSGS